MRHFFIGMLTLALVTGTSGQAVTTCDQKFKDLEAADAADSQAPRLALMKCLADEEHRHQHGVVFRPAAVMNGFYKLAVAPVPYLTTESTPKLKIAKVVQQKKTLSGGAAGFSGLADSFRRKGKQNCTCAGGTYGKDGSPKFEPQGGMHVMMTAETFMQYVTPNTSGENIAGIKKRMEDVARVIDFGTSEPFSALGQMQLGAQFDTEWLGTPNYEIATTPGLGQSPVYDGILFDTDLLKDSAISNAAKKATCTCPTSGYGTIGTNWYVGPDGTLKSQVLDAQYHSVMSDEGLGVTILRAHTPGFGQFMPFDGTR